MNNNRTNTHQAKPLTDVDQNDVKIKKTKLDEINGDLDN